ncbi:MAG: type II toxin-antitoxin system HicB family antitoxin [Gemmatimonadetes bacterium]|nr:type II toxin-antitoxin system HicB family antitoxin [Gemmatimonadota bacterium]
MPQTEYLIIVEKYGPGAYDAYVPELPGIGVAGKTEDEVHELVADAIRQYLEEHDRDGGRVTDPVVVNHYTVTI